MVVGKKATTRPLRGKRASARGSSGGLTLAEKFRAWDWAAQGMSPAEIHARMNRHRAQRGRFGPVPAA